MVQMQGLTHTAQIRQAPFRKHPQPAAPLFGQAKPIFYPEISYFHKASNAPAANLVKEEAVGGFKTAAKKILTSAAPLALYGVLLLALPKIARVTSNKICEATGEVLKSVGSNLGGAVSEVVSKGVSASMEYVKTYPVQGLAVGAGVGAATKFAPGPTRKITEFAMTTAGAAVLGIFSLVMSPMHGIRKGS